MSEIPNLGLAPVCITLCEFDVVSCQAEQQPSRTVALSVKDMSGQAVPIAGEARANIMARVRERARVVEVADDPANFFVYVTVRICMCSDCTSCFSKENETHILKA